MFALIAVSPVAVSAPQQSIQSRYESMLNVDKATAQIVGREKTSLMVKEYSTLFSRFQQPVVLHSLSIDDIKKLYYAASMTAFYTYGDDYLHDMKLDVISLENRNAHSVAPIYEDFYNSLIAYREFSEAKEFLHEHQEINGYPIPVMYGSPSGGEKNIIDVVAKTGKLELKPFDLSQKTEIVVVSHPLCHFSQNAAKYIESIPALRTIMRSHSIWIAPQGNGNFYIKQFQRWNSDHPDLRMSIVWKQSEWPDIDYWGTPAFYFFENNKLVYKVIGWPREGNRDELMDGLRKIGLVK